MIDPVNRPGLTQQAESLADLAGLINAKHAAGDQAVRTGMAHFREAGRALNKAKEIVPHGQFGDWVRKNITCSYREARRYMRVAREWAKLVSVTNLTAAMEILLDDEKDDAAEEDAPLCDRCRRVGGVQDCPQCARLAQEQEVARKNGKKRRRRAAKKLRQLEIGFDPRADHRRKLAHALEDAQTLARSVLELLPGPYGDELRSLADAHRLPFEVVEEERRDGGAVELVPVVHWPAVESLPDIFAAAVERAGKEAAGDPG